MGMSRWALCLSWIAAVWPLHHATAQNYPTKPIRIITSEPGGGNDFASRVIGQQLSDLMGQPVIIDNRAGILGVEAEAKAPPDGYTLLLNGGIIWVEPLLRENTPWDALRDFAPVTLAASSPNILVVHPSVPVRTAQELIALAKSKPGQLNYASGATGTSAHIAAEMFKSMAGVDIARVPYKGTGPAVNDMVAGQVQVMFATSASVAPLIKSGRLRALAVTSAQPSALMPGLPTVADAGLAGYVEATQYAILAPAKTPDAVIRTLNQNIVRVLARADVRDKLLNAGQEVVGSTPEQLGAVIRSEISALSKVIREAHIRAD
jgi:tripartite-type tricarboxylate transporter receptor subunit TctC